MSHFILERVSGSRVDNVGMAQMGSPRGPTAWLGRHLVNLYKENII